MEDKDDINKNINEISLATPQYDSNIFDFKGDLITIDTEVINLILSDVNKTFIIEDFSLINTYREIIEYFYDKENRILGSIELNFQDNRSQKEFLIDFVDEIIEEKYQYNETLINVRKEIEKKINDIIEEIKKCQDIKNINLEKLYRKYFQTNRIPKFLQKNVIEIFEVLKIFNEINIKSESHNLLQKEKDSKKNLICDLFIAHYFQLLRKEKKPFDVEIKEVCFDILIYSNLKDIFKNHRFKKIFVNNRVNISESLNYKEGISKMAEIFNNKNELINIEEKLKDIFKKYEINDNHPYILASFFYLIMNVMEDVATRNKQDFSFDIKINNVSNPLMVKILKNILRRLDEYCPNEEYTVETYRYLFNYYNEYIIKNVEEEKINKQYETESIMEKIKNSKNNSLIKEFDELKAKLNSSELFSSLKINLTNYIKLVPLTKKRKSHTITILISGFLSQKDEIDSWKSFFSSDTENSNYYMLKWPSSDIPSFILRTFITVGISVYSFLSCYARAEFVGKILALFLLNNDEFYDCHINLVGFSLGCRVIVNCLEELNKFSDNSFYINNVLLMGGATVIDDEEIPKWRNIIKDNIAGRIINCYSESDKVLSYLFRICVRKTPIGMKRLNIKDEKGEYSLVENFDFSDVGLGHLEYRKKFEFILKRINYFNWN